MSPHLAQVSHRQRCDFRVLGSSSTPVEINAEADGMAVGFALKSVLYPGGEKYRGSSADPIGITSDSLAPLTRQVKKALSKWVIVRSDGRRFGQVSVQGQLPDAYPGNADVEFLEDEGLILFHDG